MGKVNTVLQQTSCRPHGIPGTSTWTRWQAPSPHESLKPSLRAACTVDCLNCGYVSAENPTTALQCAPPRSRGGPVPRRAPSQGPAGAPPPAPATATWAPTRAGRLPANDNHQAGRWGGHAGAGLTRERHGREEWVGAHSAVLRRVPRGVGRDPRPLAALGAGEGRGPRLVPDWLWIGSGLAWEGRGRARCPGPHWARPREEPPPRSARWVHRGWMELAEGGPAEGTPKGSAKTRR